MTPKDSFLAVCLLLATVFGIIGVARSRYQWVLAGAVLMVPASYILMSIQGFRAAILLPLFHIGSIFALEKDKKGLASLLLLPSALLTLLALSLYAFFSFMPKENIY